jgi:hypothetical protein
MILQPHVKIVKADSAANLILESEKQLHTCLEELNYRGEYLIQAGFEEDLLLMGISQETIFITLEANLPDDLAHNEDCHVKISQVFGSIIGSFLVVIITPSQTFYAHTTPQVSDINSSPCVDADSSESTNSLGVTTNSNMSGSGQASLPMGGGNNYDLEENGSRKIHTQSADENEGAGASTALAKKRRKLDISFSWQTTISGCQTPPEDKDQYLFSMKPSITLTVG